MGEYVLEERIGQGGFGTVWRARHAVLPGKVVAVKVPRDPEMVDLLRRESILQHGLEHAGILKVLGVDLDGDVPYLVEEYAEGGDLAALLRREGALPPARAIEIFTETVTILKHAHARGVVHRDLKPGNILLDGEGRVRIGDFGLGRGLEELTKSALRESIQSLGPFTDRRVLGGTWEYMAPEQRTVSASDAKTLEPDARADIYSLGVMLHEMLRGERPAGRVGIADIAPWLDEIFARCYTSADRRYRNAGELLKALRRGRSRCRQESLDGRAVTESGSRRDAPPEPITKQMSTLGSAILQRAFFFVPLVLIGGALVFVALQEERASPGNSEPEGASSVSALEILEKGNDDALRLGRIRHWAEQNPGDIDGITDRLNNYLATAHDGGLLKTALRWKEAVEGSASPREYEVRWRRFRVHRDAYRNRFHASMEPGQPDVYVRVYQKRDGKERLVYDSSDEPMEAWGHYWPVREEAPSFKLSWCRGDGMRLELRESDLFRDDTIAHFEEDGGLSLLLLSTPRVSPDGHVVEFECDFDFGR